MDSTPENLISPRFNGNNEDNDQNNSNSIIEMKVAGKTISYQNFGKSNYRSSKAGSSMIPDSFERASETNQDQFFFKTQKI